jgi:hypothetical protein
MDHDRGSQGRLAVYSAGGAQKDRSNKRGGMIRKTNLSNRASQALIAADARLFRDLAMNSRLEPIRSSAFLALLPFLSAFAYESANYISRTDLGATRMLQPHEERLFASRMSLKLTEDKYKSSARVLENVEELIAINSGWFLDHGGILGPVKRLLQPDVGICFMKDEAVYTTHIAFLGLGLSKDDLARLYISRETLDRHIYDRSYDIGQYVGPLLSKLNVEDYKPENSLEVPLPVIEDHDMKSKVLYEAAASRVAPGQPRVGVLLTWMLWLINTARIVVPLVAAQNEVAALKIRFVSLYQTALELQRLSGDISVRNEARKRIDGLIDADSVANVLANQQLRNDLVHYGVPKRMSPQLSSKATLFGLVEARTNRQSFKDVAADVDEGLEIVSGGLYELLPQRLVLRRTA